MRALLALAILAPIAAHAQPAPQASPSTGAALFGTVCTNWMTSIAETDQLKAQLAEVQRQLAAATAPKPAPATPAPETPKP